MVYLILAQCLGFALAHAAADVTCGETPRPHSPDRYEDFYRIRRQAEERDQKRDAGVAEIRGRGQERVEKLEAARREYVQHRRVKPDDEHAEAAYREQARERARRVEDARECYVSRRDHAGRGGGRELSADTEYGLDE